MKQKGFTLIEVLAVISLIAAVSLVMLPTIINQINRSKGDLDEATIKLIENATYNYMDMNQSIYSMKSGKKYCINLKTLVDSGFLKDNLKYSSTNKKIDLTKNVEVTFTTDIDIQYDVKSSCTVNP